MRRRRRRVGHVGPLEVARVGEVEGAGPQRQAIRQRHPGGEIGDGVGRRHEAIATGNALALAARGARPRPRHPSVPRSPCIPGRRRPGPARSSTCSAGSGGPAGPPRPSARSGRGDRGSCRTGGDCSCRRRSPARHARPAGARCGSARCRRSCPACSRACRGDRCGPARRCAARGRPARCRWPGRRRSTPRLSNTLTSNNLSGLLAFSAGRRRFDEWRPIAE